jgi:hypothetical protein
MIQEIYLDSSGRDLVLGSSSDPDRTEGKCTIRISNPIEDPKELKSLTLDCNMVEHSQPRFKNSYRPRDDNQGQCGEKEKDDQKDERQGSVSSEEMGDPQDNSDADSRSSSPIPCNLKHNEICKEVSLKVPDKVLKAVGEVTNCMDSYKKLCKDIAVFHRKEFDLLHTEFKHICDDSNTISYRSEELLKNFRQSTSAMFKQFDTIEVLQQSASDLAFALKNVLLQVHNDAMSLDDYYHIINKLILGALTTLSCKVKRMDPQFKALKSNVQNVFHGWNLISPTKAHNGTWVVDITNVIGRMKEARIENPKILPQKCKEGPIEAGGSNQVNKKGSIER